MVRIATWNVNSLKARLPRVEAWLADVHPDVVCLQETKLADEAFPSLTFAGLGYEAAHHGEGRWNGVALLSRIGLADVATGFADGGGPDPDARALWATCAGVRIASLYVPNGRTLDHEHYRYKLAWLARVRAHLEANHSPGDPVVLCGDFNVAPTDLDVWDPEEFIGATHVSDPERSALRELETWGVRDVFRMLQPEAGLYTFWDYRGGSFHKRHGMRIDLALATEPLASRATYAVVDRNARKGPQPSDHAPLVVDFDVAEAA